METITVNHGVLSGNKVSELRNEAFNEFSDAPFEFEGTAVALWGDTQKVYYHACIANRFSEDYLVYCNQLEKNIKQLGSFCLTRAVLEQKGIALPKLKDLTIHELVCMVSFHFRKAHAALDGIYKDNDLLGMTYLNWEFRWVGLGNRLKATEVKIRKIKEGKVNVDSLLQETETFKGEGRTNAELSAPKSLNVNPAAMPINGSVARQMLKEEKAEEKQAAAIRKEKDRLLDLAEKLERKASGLPAPIRPPRPFAPDKEDMKIVNRENAAYLRRKAAALSVPEPNSAQLPEINKAAPGMLTEAEARKRLMDDAMKRKDQAAILSIPMEDSNALHERWEKYVERVEREAKGPPGGPSPETRKALREKRKKRR